MKLAESQAKAKITEIDEKPEIDIIENIAKDESASPEEKLEAIKTVVEVVKEIKKTAETNTTSLAIPVPE